MENLINDVKELYEKLLVRSRKFDEENSKLNNKREKVDADTQASKQLIDELEKREKKVKAIEDVVKLKDEVATSHRTFLSDKKLLNKDKAEFEEEKKKHTEENKAESEAISAKKIKLQKAQLALDKDKTTYKIEVMGNINKLLADKGIKL